MASSRVATAVTMDVTDVKTAVKQASDSMKKLVGVAKQSDKSLSTLAFFKKWEVGLRLFNKIVGTATKTTQTFFNILKNPISGIPLIGQLVGPFEQFVKNTTQATLDQFNLGRAIGASFDEMQALALAAQDVGLQVNQLYEPISKLPRKIQEAAAGFGDSVAVFSQLPGVNIDALRDLGATKGGIAQLKVVADSLNRITDQNQKLYLLTKIFEETGPKFQQLFELGSKGIDEFIKDVERLGLSLGKYGIATLKVLNLEMGKLGASWAALSRDILIEISPSLIAFLRIIQDTVADPNFRKEFVTTVSSLFESVGAALLSYSTSFLEFAKEVAKLTAILAKNVEVFVPNEKTGVSDYFASKALPWADRLNAIGLGNETSRRNAEVWRRQLAGEGEFREASNQIDAFSEALGKGRGRIIEVWNDIEKKAEMIRKQSLQGAKTWEKDEEALDKFIEKISYRAVSNAASGAAPGKLSAADATTQAGVELMLKSIDDGYKETKEVTMLKKIEKVLQKIEKKADGQIVNVQGAA